MLPSLSLPFRQPRCIPKVILLSISVWKVATFAEASKCRGEFVHRESNPALSQTHSFVVICLSVIR